MKTLRYTLSRLLAPFTLGFLALAPLAHAQTSSSSGVDTIGTVLLKVVYLINVYIVPLVFALAFIVFIFGVFRYFVAGAANEEKRQEGVKFVMYGLIGFVLMLSVWGLVNLLLRSTGFGGQSQPDLPTFHVPGASGSGSTQFGTTNTTSGSDCQTTGCLPGSICTPVSGSYACVPSNDAGPDINDIPH